MQQNYATLADAIDAYEAGEIPDDDMIELLATWPYATPSYVAQEAGLDRAELYLAIEDRIYGDPPGTYYDVVTAGDLGRIPWEIIDAATNLVLERTNDPRRPSARKQAGS